MEELDAILELEEAEVRRAHEANKQALEVEAIQAFNNSNLSDLPSF